MEKLPVIGNEEFGVRLTKIQESLKAGGLDGLIVFGSYPDREGAVTYLSNFREGYPDSLGQGGAGFSALVLAATGLITLVSQAASPGQSLANTEAVKTGPSLVPEVAGAIREKDLVAGKIGVVGLDLIPAGIWQALQKACAKAEFEAADGLLNAIRGKKSLQEAAILAQAAWVGEQAVTAGMEAARAGQRQAALEMAMRQAAQQAGAELVSRIGVISGPSLTPGGWPPVSDRILESGDFVMLKIAGWTGGYAFSTAKTMVAGQASAQQRDHLAHLDEALDWMVGTLQPNADVGYVLTMHREQRIMPSAHGVGLDVFEHPWVSMGPMPQKPIMRPGTVMCVDPLIMDANFGLMANQATVLVTDSGPRVLKEV